MTIAVALILGTAAAGQYLTGYVIELALSVDNVFVWAVILERFLVPAPYRHRVLYWGVFGALVLRFAFILSGVTLLERLHWLAYVLGGVLLFTAWRVARHAPEEMQLERNPVLRLVRRWLPITPDYRAEHLVVQEGGRWMATPLLVVLVLIETTDIVFAVDSVPAVLAVSRDPYVVFTSNAFAILGLRSMYFLLEGTRDRLVHLNRGLAVILAFVGLRMLTERWIELPTWGALAFIALVLTLTVVSSLRASRGFNRAAG